MHRHIGLMHARAHCAVRAVSARLRDPAGQGTVEYVGLILLVSALMLGVVAAAKGKHFDDGNSIATALVKKIEKAIQNVRF